MSRRRRDWKTERRVKGSRKFPRQLSRLSEIASRRVSLYTHHVPYPCIIAVSFVLPDSQSSLNMPSIRSGSSKAPNTAPYDSQNRSRRRQASNRPAEPAATSPSTPRQAQDDSNSSTPRPQTSFALPVTTPARESGPANAQTPSRGPNTSGRVEPPSGSSAMSSLYEEIKPGRPHKKKVKSAAVKRVRRVEPLTELPYVCAGLNLTIIDRPCRPVAPDAMTVADTPMYVIRMFFLHVVHAYIGMHSSSQPIAGSSTGIGTIEGSCMRESQAVPDGAKVVELNSISYYETLPTRELLVRDRARCEAEREKKAEDVQLDTNRRVAAVLDKITAPEDQGGAGFKTLYEFVDGLFTSTKRETSLRTQRLCNDHGVEIIHHVARRAPEQGREAAMDIMDEVLRGEGQALRDLFAKKQHSTLADVLAEFSMAELTTRVSSVAPTLWRMLSQAAGERPRGKQDHDPNIVCLSPPASHTC